MESGDKYSAPGEVPLSVDFEIELFENAPSDGFKGSLRMSRGYIEDHYIMIGKGEEDENSTPDEVPPSVKFVNELQSKTNVEVNATGVTLTKNAKADAEVIVATVTVARDSELGCIKIKAWNIPVFHVSSDIDEEKGKNNENDSGVVNDKDNDSGIESESSTYSSSEDSKHSLILLPSK